MFFSNATQLLLLKKSCDLDGTRISYIHSGVIAQKMMNVAITSHYAE